MNRPTKYFLLPFLIQVVLSICGLQPICYAQTDNKANAAWSGFGIEASMIAGKVYKHESKFTLPIPALTTGTEVNLTLRTYGKKNWEQLCHYPTMGLGFTYINYGLDDIYGRCLGIYPNISFRLIGSKKIDWSFRIGDGIGYVSKTFRRVAPVDTINVAIGSHFNDFAMLMTDLRWHINMHWDAELGANITHISNASIGKPNLGINMIGTHFGLVYFPVTSTPTRIARDLPPLSNRWLLQARLSMAYVSSYTHGGPLYPVYLSSVYTSRRWHSRYKVFAGIDYVYYQNIYSWLRNNQLAVGKEKEQSYKSAIFAGNEFLFGRLGISLQMGYYLHQAAIKTSSVYEKVGGQYYLVQKEKGPLKEFFLSAYVKTHGSVAELGELGLGFGF